jgi:hypothetical protein
MGKYDADAVWFKENRPRTAERWPSAASRDQHPGEETKLLELHAIAPSDARLCSASGGLSDSAFFILLAFAFSAKLATNGALLRPRLYPELQLLIPEVLLFRPKHKRRTAILTSQWHIEIR